jgi:hypothetical protein
VATYLYGLILARNAHLVPAHIIGIDGTPVRVVSCNGLDALVSTLARAPARASLDDIRAHDHALQSVVHHGSTAAATRFGQSFSADSDVRQHVGERGGHVAKLLDEFDGCVEMRLLLSLVIAGPVSGSAAATNVGPGRAYLESVRERTGTSRLKGLELRESLGPVVRAERVEELPHSRGAVFAHLVRRADEPAYRDAVASHPALATATVVGPLALYSFAEPAE